MLLAHYVCVLVHSRVSSRVRQTCELVHSLSLAVAITNHTAWNGKFPTHLALSRCFEGPRAQSNKLDTFHHFLNSPRTSPRTCPDSAGYDFSDVHLRTVMHCNILTRYPFRHLLLRSLECWRTMLWLQRCPSLCPHERFRIAPEYDQYGSVKLKWTEEDLYVVLLCCS